MATTQAEALAAAARDIQIVLDHRKHLIEALQELARRTAAHGCWEPAVATPNGTCRDYYGIDRTHWCGACFAATLIDEEAG